MVLDHDDSEYQVAREFHPGVFVRSFYFRDPDGILLEFAAWTREMGRRRRRRRPSGRPRRHARRRIARRRIGSRGCRRGASGPYWRTSRGSSPTGPVVSTAAMPGHPPAASQRERDLRLSSVTRPDSRKARTVLVAATDRSENFVDLDVPRLGVDRAPRSSSSSCSRSISTATVTRTRPRRARRSVNRSSGCCAGLSFGAIVAISFGSAAFGEYISGYLIEKSLSVDNVFVWSMLFTTMAIPAEVPAPRCCSGASSARSRFAAIFIFARQRADRPVLVAAARVRRVPRLHRRSRSSATAPTRASTKPHRGLGLLQRIMPGQRRARRTEVLHQGQRRSGPPPRCSPRSSWSRSPTSSSPSTRCRRSSPCPTSRSWCSPRNAFAILGPAGDVLPAGQRQGAFPLPVARARRHPDLRRSQDDGVALVPRQHVPVARA